MDEHPLERRSRLLGERAKHNREILAESFRGSRGRPLFTKRVPEREALVFWREHRFDQIGFQRLALLSPIERLELDNWLTRETEIERIQQQLMGGTNDAS